MQCGVYMVCIVPHPICNTSDATFNPCPNTVLTGYYNRVLCVCLYVCVCLQWALHHLCDSSAGVSDILPWLDCSLPLDGCHSYLLQGTHA